MCWQYADRLESLRQLEYELEEVRNEVQLKSRQAVDINDSLNVVKVEMASLREQKNNAEKEVCTWIYCLWLKDMAMLWEINLLWSILLEMWHVLVHHVWIHMWWTKMAHISNSMQQRKLTLTTWSVDCCLSLGCFIATSAFKQSVSVDCWCYTVVWWDGKDVDELQLPLWIPYNCTLIYVSLSSIVTCRFCYWLNMAVHYSRVHSYAQYGSAV